jgi:allantoinase
MCAAPARLAGFEGLKGAIAPECDADLVSWDPEASFEVDAEQLHHGHKLTPYTGRTLYGTVRLTLLDGGISYDDGELDGLPKGRLLLPGEEGDERTRGFFRGSSVRTFGRRRARRE